MVDVQPINTFYVGVVIVKSNKISGHIETYDFNNPLQLTLFNTRYNKDNTLFDVPKLNDCHVKHLNKNDQTMIIHVGTNYSNVASYTSQCVEQQFNSKIC